MQQWMLIFKYYNEFGTRTTTSLLPPLHAPVEYWPLTRKSPLSSHPMVVGGAGHCGPALLQHDITLSLFTSFPCLQHCLPLSILSRLPLLIVMFLVIAISPLVCCLVNLKWPDATSTLLSCNNRPAPTQAHGAPLRIHPLTVATGIPLARA